MTPIARRGRQRGAALLEMALAVGLLSLLLFGIITFGVTLSFKQNMTQATNEAARAAATAPRDLALARAQAAAERATGGFGVRCNNNEGLDCEFPIAACSNDPSQDCMTVELRYDLEHFPRVPSVGAVSSALPSTLVSRAVVVLNR